MKFGQKFENLTIWMKKAKGQDISPNEMPNSAFLIDVTPNRLTHGLQCGCQSQMSKIYSCCRILNTEQEQNSPQIGMYNWHLSCEHLMFHHSHIIGVNHSSLNIMCNVYGFFQLISHTWIFCCTLVIAFCPLFFYKTRSLGPRLGVVCPSHPPGGVIHAKVTLHMFLVHQPVRSALEWIFCYEKQQQQQQEQRILGV